MSEQNGTAQPSQGEWWPVVFNEHTRELLFETEDEAVAFADRMNALVYETHPWNQAFAGAFAEVGSVRLEARDA